MDVHMYVSYKAHMQDVAREETRSNEKFYVIRPAA